MVSGVDFEWSVWIESNILLNLLEAAGSHLHHPSISNFITPMENNKSTYNGNKLV